MTFYYYIAGFFSGIFLANAVPHFVHGISGNKFPTSFSKPGGIGLSSPTTNVIWALVNFVAGYLLFRAGNVHSADSISLLVFFAGVAVISIFSSIHFQKKHTE
jgi:hypothetical protein